jgi:hypothetical protein
MFDSSVVAKETSNGSSINQNPSTHALLTHWMVLVKIRPRPGDNGNARIILMDGSGTTITTFTGIALPYSGLAVGVKGPRRDIHNGDTPFGVYKFVETAGGTPQDRLPPGFGTGKVYLHDKDLYGEVADAQRSLIRLHGGGSALAEPYALNQPLLPTKGCVRMKNADVNDLIQRLKQLTPDNSVQFIFMGDDAYLTRLATDTTLNTKPWWSALRTALHIPATPIVSGISMTSGVTSSASMSVAPEPQSLTTGENVAPQTPESLIELVNVFAEDVGPKGQEALNALRSRTAELVSLQTSLPADDALRPKLAFVLCNLDHDAEANRSVLQSALTDPSQYKSVFADQVQDMISRLIDREDELGNEQASTSLTRSLIASAPQADGALSEGLGITLSKQLRVRSGVFLSAWGEHFSAMAPEESKGLKTKVYALMKASHRLTPGEIANIRTYLYSLRDFSEEFGDAVKDFSQMYFHPTGNKRQRQRQFRR